MTEKLCLWCQTPNATKYDDFGRGPYCNYEHAKDHYVHGCTSDEYEEAFQASKNRPKYYVRYNVESNRYEVLERSMDKPRLVDDWSLSDDANAQAYAMNGEHNAKSKNNRPR